MNPELEAFGPEVLLKATALMAGLYLHARDLDRAERCMHSMLHLFGVNGSHKVLLSQRPLRSDGKYLFTIT